MRKIAIANLKGGVGKTATATALAVGLAQRGHRTLCVDCDPSGNASWILLEGQGADGPSLADVLTRQVDAHEAIRPTPTKGLDLLPATAALGGVGVSLAQELGRDVRLRSCLDGVEGYAYIVVDTPPTVSSLLVNALTFASEVIVPVDAGVFAALGLIEMQHVIEEIRAAYNPALRLAGLLLAKVPRNSVAKDVESQLRAKFGPLVYSATIPLAVAVEAAASRGQTVLEFDPKSAPARAYTQFIAEVLNHGGGKQARRGGSTGGRSGVIDAA